MNNAPIDWVKAGALIDELRDEEAECVGICCDICCDNADSGPHSAITVVGPWTSWRERTVFGDSVIACLEQAARERREWKASAR